MKDPYQVLGVSPNATDDEIKQAYRALVRKYHPDKYAGTDLADMANEKMKDINAAYEQIQEMRKRGATGEYSTAGDRSYSSSHENYSQSSGGIYAQIRSMINAGELEKAEILLQSVGQQDRQAEWYFLAGCLLLRRGRIVDAQAYLDHACRLDPYNAEFRSRRDQLRTETQANTASGGYRSSSSSGCSGCDICSSLLCADCCCECMGGDLIRCC